VRSILVKNFLLQHTSSQVNLSSHLLHIHTGNYGLVTG